MDGMFFRFTAAGALGALALGIAGCATTGVVVAPVMITTRDITGAVVTLPTVVTRTDGNGSCLYKLEFAPPDDNVRFIAEIGGNRGPAQRIDSCLALPPAFNATSTSNVAWFEEQTTYYWAKKARDYAKAALWVTPPGWTGPSPKLANAQVDISVLKHNDDATGFGTACFPRDPGGCMRFWPGTPPKIFIQAGFAGENLVGHEFGHYAAGFVFGHMDIGSDGFDITSCAHRSFQEAIAETFVQLLEHHEITSAGPFTVSSTITNYNSKWRNECTDSEYPMALPLWEAFTQSVWGSGKDVNGNALVVPWPNAAAANTAMINAFTFALATTKGLRHYLIAQSAVEHVEKNQPANIAAMVRAIFASHDLLAADVGKACIENAECASKRCDRGDGTSKTSLCVPAAASGTTGSLCTNDNQCSSSHCVGLVVDRENQWIPGRCAAKVPMGQACASNSQCTTNYCDRGDNTSHTGLCLKGDGTATQGEACSNDNQCISRNCAGLTTDAAGNWVAGRCAARSALGRFCQKDSDCDSNDCDVGPGSAGSNLCTAVNGFGQTNDLCTQNQQCSSGLCALLETGANGLPIPGRCGITGGTIGSSCTGNSQCSSGYCDAGNNTSHTSLCLPAGGSGSIGTLCSHDNQCQSSICGGLSRNQAGQWVPGRCAVAGPLGTACSNNRQCASNYCDAGLGTSRTSECMPAGGAGAVGQMCSHDNQCASSNCSGLTQNAAGEWIPGACAAKLGLGEHCSANYLCASGYCDAGDGTSKTSKCMPPAGAGTNGQLCSNDNQCSSGNCPGLRQDTYYNWIPGNCAAKFPLNTSCNANSQCASNYCDAGNGTSHSSKCMPAGRTGVSGNACTHNNQCASNVCNGLMPKADGSWSPGICQ
jgi:hypothetical protein